MNKMYKQMGEILVTKGLITGDQLQEVLHEQQLTKEFLGKILLKRKLITESDLLKTLSEQFGFSFISFKKEDVNLDITMQFSPTLILDHKCFPVKQDDYSITVAITNPLDAWALSVVEKESKLRKVKFVLVSEKDMQWLLQQYRQYKTVNIQRLFEGNEE